VTDPAPDPLPVRSAAARRGRLADSPPVPPLPTERVDDELRRGRDRRRAGLKRRARRRRASR
jgi:hypothetical protein